MSRNSSRRPEGRRQRAVLDDDAASSVAGSIPGTQASSVVNGGYDDPVRDEVIAELFGDERDDLDEDDEGGEDLFGDDMERDYRPQPELDVLSQSGIDDDEVASEMSFGARRAAEMEMEERDAVNFGDRHLFYDAGDASQSQSNDHRHRRQPLRKRPEIIQEEEKMEEDVPVDNLDNMRGRAVRDHVNDEAVAREIVRRFKRFLKNFKDPKTDKHKYVLQIQQMASENRESLIIDYEDLADNEPSITFFLPEAPLEVIELFDNAATEVVSLMYPHYKRICATIHARIAGLPTFEEIRMLRHIHLNMLITTSGVVTVTSGILPRLSLVKYNCIACGYVIGPITQGSEDEVKPSSCASCQSRGPFELNVEETVYQNYQRITIQEAPNLFVAGQISSVNVFLTGDLCDACKLGDEIEITGVFANNYDSSLNTRQGFPVFAAVILANYIRTKDHLPFYYKYQRWSLPDSIIYCISKNPSSPKCYEKMSQCCKYMLLKLRVVAISDVVVCYDHWKWVISFNKKKVDLDNITIKMWISGSLRLESSCNSITSLSLLSSFISKIYRCEAKDVYISKQHIYIEDFKMIACSADSITLNDVTLYDEKISQHHPLIYQTMVTLEDIIRSLPDVKKFAYKMDINAYYVITPQTVQELIHNPIFCQLDIFTLKNVPEIFDIDTLFDFAKTNETVLIQLEYMFIPRRPARLRLKEIVEEIIETKNALYKKPCIILPD